jgi:hypothetical protein
MLERSQIRLITYVGFSYDREKVDEASFTRLNLHKVGLSLLTSVVIITSYCLKSIKEILGHVSTLRLSALHIVLL